MATDQPGWRPDPERPGQLRWWNGLGWSDARRTANAATDRVRDAATEAVRGSTTTPLEVARATADRSGSVAVPTERAAAAGNPFAAAGLLLALAGLVLGGWGLMPLAGAVLSLAGLVRALRLARRGVRSTGLGGALGGLVVSVAALLRWVPVLAPALPDVLRMLG